VNLLAVDELSVTFETPDGPVHAVRDLNFRLDRKETLGIVGESGSGKSQAMAAILGLLPANGAATGSVRMEGEEVLNRGEAVLRKIRGRRISIIFQDPMTSLSPYMTIGHQLGRVLLEQRGLSGDTARAEVIRMLDAVRVPAAKDRLVSYPHELSGGMCQRVLIAAALLCRPDVLIADEPTTALDVTVQADILDLLRELQASFRTAMILITHDLGIVAGACDRLIVLDQGRAVEEGETETVFADPQTEQTRALIEAVPRLDRERGRGPVTAITGEPLLAADNVVVQFLRPRHHWFRRGKFEAVIDVSLAIHPSETLAIVGESGCGKSTLVRSLMRLVPIAAGEIRFLGRAFADMDRDADKRARRDLQLVFQDPLGSLDPRMTIEQIVGEPLRVHRHDLPRADRLQRVVSMLERVGLGASMLNRYPHEFSGGQCQRIGIARALITEPRVLICDEAVSALDVTVQASVLELLAGLQNELGIGIIFIAHDLAVVRRVSHRVMVMYLGRIVEVADAHTLYARPRHPYTRALIDSVPIPDPVLERKRERTIPLGEVPDPWDLPPGCAYRARCPYAIDVCAEQRPPLAPLSGKAGLHRVACHRAAELDLSVADQGVAGGDNGIGTPLSDSIPSS
jgi:oligopeptide/dipeptide ABC transporter ATP-binding protein